MARIGPDTIEQAVRRAVDTALDTPIFKFGADVFSINGLLAAIKNSEIDFVTHGCWIEEADRDRHWHCSECGYVVGLAGKTFKYCPECGARMDGDDKCG